jgi:uncharacterized membrane protein
MSSTRKIIEKTIKGPTKIEHGTYFYAVQSSIMYRFLLAPNANLCMITEKKALSSEHDRNC